MKYQSNAKWPTGTGVSLMNEENVSTDDHSSRGAAQAICNMLERDGFGGNRQIFPIKTWVTPEEGE